MNNSATKRVVTVFLLKSTRHSIVSWKDAAERQTRTVDRKCATSAASNGERIVVKPESATSRVSETCIQKCGVHTQIQLLLAWKR